MRFGSTAKVLLKCKLKYYRISECARPLTQTTTPVLQVVSGTVKGDLYIWAEGLVEALIQRTGNTPCHAGFVEAVVYDHVSKTLVSGGADGCVPPTYLDGASCAD